MHLDPIIEEFKDKNCFVRRHGESLFILEREIKGLMPE
jgi:hypothetical protein